MYLAVFGVRQSVDQRVVNAWSLGQKNGQCGEKWGDLGDISPCSHHADDGEWSPCSHPEGNVHDGDLSDADLGRDLLLVAVASQRSDVHFLGLGTEFFFVFENSLNDRVVAAGDDGDGYNVVSNAGSQNVGLIVHRLNQSIQKYLVT